MTIAYTFNVLLITLALLTGLWAFWMAAWLLNRRRVELAAAACARGLLANFLVGLIPFSVLLAAAGALAQAGGPALVPAVILYVFLFCFAQTGVAGLALLLGERAWQGQAPLPPWQTMSRGGLILALVFLVPVLGWLAFLVGSAVVGTGANLRAVLALRKEKKLAKTAPSPASALAEPPLMETA